ncbi:MAG: cytochrome P460 family protein [Rhizobiaceae bacterium]|nr:MAG: cytochrome P460 family protein [Rhizobiaceae bacterium]
MLILLAPVLLGAGFVTFEALQVSAETNRVQFPELDALVHYTTVRRGEVTEHIMTTPEAIEAIKQGHPAPNGTHFVLVDYRDDEVFRYFVMQKEASWGADYPNGRTGDWQFQWFQPDRSVNLNENTARCQSCHANRSGTDFLFTANRIPRFEGTPIE